MKYIKYLIISVISALACSCSDDAPSEIVNLGKCKAEVVDLTPESFGIKVDLENWDADKHITVYIQEVDGDFHTYKDVYSESPTAVFEQILVSGKTYQYNVVEKVSGRYGVDCELVTDTVTLPTMEEYINENFGTCVMEQSVLTHNSAVITAKLPDGVRYNGTMSKLIYSTSPDFADAKEVEGYYYDYYDDYKFKSASFPLTDLQANTKYYVKIHGGFTTGNLDFNDYDLHFSPDSFTTLSEGQISFDARCSLTVDYILDTEARIDVFLPDEWRIYEEDPSAPTNCTLIYGTDPTFAKNTSESDDSPSYLTGYSITVLEDLLPETTYYVALKGDFECLGIVVKNLVIPADKSFTTSHQNQVEMIDGHACVDLGLSVKWATDDLKVGSQESFRWSDTDTSSWGASWQIPSEAQFKELIDNCTILSGNDLIFVANNGNYIKLQYICYYWTSNAKVFRSNISDINYYKSGYYDISELFSEPYPSASIRPVTTK